MNEDKKNSKMNYGKNKKNIKEKNTEKSIEKSTENEIKKKRKKNKKMNTDLNKAVNPKKILGIVSIFIHVSTFLMTIIRYFIGGMLPGIIYNILMGASLVLYLILPIYIHGIIKQDKENQESTPKEKSRRGKFIKYNLRSFSWLLVAFVLMVIGHLLWAFSDPAEGAKNRIIFFWMEGGAFGFSIFFQIKLLLEFLLKPPRPKGRGFLRVC